MASSPADTALCSRYARVTSNQSNTMISRAVSMAPASFEVTYKMTYESAPLTSSVRGAGGALATSRDSG